MAGLLLTSDRCTVKKHHFHKPYRPPQLSSRGRPLTGQKYQDTATKLSNHATLDERANGHHAAEVDPREPNDISLYDANKDVHQVLVKKAGAYLTASLGSSSEILFSDRDTDDTASTPKQSTSNLHVNVSKTIHQRIFAGAS